MILQEPGWQEGNPGMAARIDTRLFTAIWAFALCASVPGHARERPPTVVLIFIDDMGYGDIGPFGSKINQTPHLDRMAEEGRKLTSFYVASPVCTPSRAALMTGSYSRRVGLGMGSDHLVLFPGDAHALHPDEITLAEHLRRHPHLDGPAAHPGPVGRRLRSRRPRHRRQGHRTAAAW